MLSTPADAREGDAVRRLGVAEVEALILSRGVMPSQNWSISPPSPFTTKSMAAP
jgi:hypothetical protein